MDNYYGYPSKYSFAKSLSKPQSSNSNYGNHFRDLRSQRSIIGNAYQGKYHNSYHQEDDFRILSSKINRKYHKSKLSHMNANKIDLGTEMFQNEHTQVSET